MIGTTRLVLPLSLLMMLLLLLLQPQVCFSLIVKDDDGYDDRDDGVVVTSSSSSSVVVDESSITTTTTTATKTRKKMTTIIHNNKNNENHQNNNKDDDDGIFINSNNKKKKKKTILITANLMKSHVLSFLPLAEELLDRGHKVIFAIPNSKEMKEWFPESPLKGMELIYAVDYDDDEYEYDITSNTSDEQQQREIFHGQSVKHLGWFEFFTMFLDRIKNLQTVIVEPIFELHDAIPKIIQQKKVDVVVTSFMMLGVLEVLKNHQQQHHHHRQQQQQQQQQMNNNDHNVDGDCDAAVPPRLRWISVAHVPMLPGYALDSSVDDDDSSLEVKCRLPNDFNGYTMSDMKSSFVIRVKNQIGCLFVDFYIRYLAMPLINSYRRLKLHNHDNNNNNQSTTFVFFDTFAQAVTTHAPVTVFFDGPPMMIPFPLSSKQSPKPFLRDTIRPIGIVQSKHPAPITGDLKDWFERQTSSSSSSSSPSSMVIIYLSMGTDYEIPRADGEQLIRSLKILVEDRGCRILWSLREEQQAVFADLLPSRSTSDDDDDQYDKRWKIVNFVPQASVLKHGSVKMFVSHCGWGSVGDALSAGKPILAYPGFADQPHNAARLVDNGAAILVKHDFSNFLDAASLILDNYDEFKETATRIGQELLSLGGLDALADIVVPPEDDDVCEAVEATRAFQPTLDPFLDIPQTMEHAVAVSVFVLLGFLCVLLPAFGVWCCCCRSGVRRKMNDEDQSEEKDPSTPKQKCQS